MKAYVITVSGFDPVVVFALTRAKARWVALAGARDAGYGLKFAGLSSKREKRLDKFFTPDKANRYFSFEALK